MPNRNYKYKCGKFLIKTYEDLYFQQKHLHTDVDTRVEYIEDTIGEPDAIFGRIEYQLTQEKRK